MIGEAKDARYVNEALGAATESRDPWAHRSRRMACHSCMWWVAKAVDRPYPPNVVEPARLGRCRRHAPTMSGYPVVFETDWCGDHKLDETKI